nr:PREDICTED: cilia- and flagella-associated protein 70 [Tribolium castaneum]|eukprot:XP_015834828.1 PREDICTED: cilia- and flagella-associated protein 70 [Tribolium castaneum]
MLNKQLDTTLCKKIVKEVIYKINETYCTYIEKKNQCHCSNQADFLTYIKRSGLYQNLVFTVGHVACLIAQFKLDKIEKVQSIHKYHNFLEHIFVWLMSEVNHVLNEMTTIGRHIKAFPESSLKSLLFYAKEAEEIGNAALAEQYYLKRMQYDPTNPGPWFDFAVYKVGKGDYESALMCLQEALTRKLYHHNSLLLTGVLLAETKRFKEAEMCLLTLMVQESRWTEGWAVLYLFYKEVDNAGGMDLSKEMVLKYLDDPRSPTDDFIKNEDLVWTSEICPNTLYFKASVILLKMRLYSWVENALACELREPGVVHYLLAVICYYKKNYHHALEHLDRARFFHGSDRAVLSLTGHCYLAIGKQQEAYEQYSHILESFQRPDNIHLVYLNCAKVAPNAQEAKKLLLTACKHRPTPYTWMACGIAYLKLNDFLSAEECFSESVFLDNSRADAWGYLTLTNLKMRRLNEAEMCYALALKNDLTDQCLLDEIQIGFEKLKSK